VAVHDDGVDDLGEEGGRQDRDGNLPDGVSCAWERRGVEDASGGDRRQGARGQDGSTVGDDATQR
jgi:hypothetical protein